MRYCTKFDQETLRYFGSEALTENRKRMYEQYAVLRNEIETYLAHSRNYIASLEDYVGAQAMLGGYTLMPLNMFTWLYCVGCSEKERTELFRKMADASMDLDENGLRKAPVTRRVKELIRSREGFTKNGEQSYGHMQALICCLACAMRKKREPAREFRKAICDIIPPFKWYMTECSDVLTARYSPQMTSGWNIAVLKCEETRLAELLLLYLLYRANAMLERRNSGIIAGEPKTRWLARVQAMLMASREENKHSVLNYGFLGGLTVVWEN